MAQQEKKLQFFEDFALIRYKDRNEVKVLKEDEFIYAFQKRLNDEYWNKVLLVQTCVKSKLGVGKPIFVHYYAPLNQDNPAEKIDYSLKNYWDKFAKSNTVNDN